jgi:hypothetical protein
MSRLELSDEDFLTLYARNRTLGKIIHETRVGEVEGIRFDLRHNKIKPTEWTMDHLGGFDGHVPRRISTLPFIWFPWYGKFDLKQLKAEIMEEFLSAKEYEKNAPPTPREVYGNITDVEYAEYLRAERKNKRVTKTWIKDELEFRTPDAIVNAGDCIRIHRAVMSIDDNEFMPLHDKAEIHLFVRITNETGLSKALNTPIIMQGATRITYRHGNKGIYSILARVRNHHGLNKINQTFVREVSDNYNKKGYDYAALYKSISLSEHFLPLSWKLQRSNNRGRERIGMKFLEAMDDACMLGYTWAYAEAERSMRPLAAAALASRAGAGRAGQASGVRRRAKAAETWQLLIKKEAEKIRSKEPRFSQAKLAEEIKFKFDDKVPSHPVIVRHIAKLERDNELPKRRR